MNCTFAGSARRGIFHASIQRSRGVDSAGTSTSASWMRAEYQCKAPLIPASPCLLLIRTRSQSLSMCPTRIGVNARDLRLCAKHDTRTIRSMPVDQAIQTSLLYLPTIPALSLAIPSRPLCQSSHLQITVLLRLPLNVTRCPHSHTICFRTTRLS